MGSYILVLCSSNMESLKMTFFFCLLLSSTVIQAKPVFIIVDAALATAVAAGTVAAVGAGATAAAGVIGAGITAAGAVATGAAAALAPVGAAAVAAAPNILLGKALVGSGFLLGANAGRLVKQLQEG